MLKATEGSQLLESHKQLYEKLVKIPQNREMKYREEIKREKLIGMPRFEARNYQWDVTLLTQLKDHLQKVWDFFSTYSFWFDDSLYPLIAWDDRRCSKKSIIFLLERDVWETDEVFGDYLIEEKEDAMYLSYFRFDQKFKTQQTPLMEKIDRKEWVCKDAQNQIIAQFTYLWNKLAVEIQSCIDESFSKEPKPLPTSNELKSIFAQITEFYPKYPEAALLSLGRVAEQWLLLLLEKPEKGLHDDLIRIAEIRGKLSPKLEKLFSLIRSHYNKLKHKTYYRVKTSTLQALIEQFRELVHDETNILENY